MTLAPGTRLGRYEVTAPLGAGGMGEVYRARDASLGRDVAVKVLPLGALGDADHLLRFEREAKATGALNHPNVLAVYDTGVHDGQPYVVSELLEGETLRQRLTAGPLPVRKALEYAGAIARGLGAAHDKGIVHRDLKPENLFLTRDGNVKVLDFGLAKRLKLRAGDTEATGSLTADPATEPGTVLGTVGYMSPEQVRGLPADARSDIFSLGAILYEMLTGQRAFRGETGADALRAILREDPAPVSSVRPQLSPALERLVERCLEKMPEERFQSARDLAFALEALATVSSRDAHPPAAPPRRRLATAAAIAATFAGLGLAAWLGRATAPVRLPRFEALTFRRGIAGPARFAPDGQTVVYSAAWDGGPPEIYSTRTDSPESKPLGLPPAQLLSVSARGDMAILLTQERNVARSVGTLATVPLMGGAPRPVLEQVQDADWGPDGERLCVLRTVDGHTQIEFPIGKVLVQDNDVLWPRVSPRGDRIAFLGKGVEVVDLSGHRTVLTERPHVQYGLAWSPSGDEILFTAGDTGRNRALHAVTLSGRQRLVARVAGSLTAYDVTKDGRALVGYGFGHNAVSALPPGAAAERELSIFNRSQLVDLSASGDNVLIREYTLRTPEDLGTAYLRRTDGSPPVRLGVGLPLALSPDGTHVATLLPGGRFVELPTGPGEAREVGLAGLPQGSRPLAARWSADGRRTFLAAAMAGHRPRVFVRDAGAAAWRATTPDLVDPPFEVSPDGARIAALGANEGLAIYPIDGGSVREFPGVAGFPVHWTADGKALYLRRPGQPVALIDRLEIESGRVQPFRELMPSDPTGVAAILGVRFARDGRSYAYDFSRQLSDLYLVTGLE